MKSFGRKDIALLTIVFLVLLGIWIAVIMWGMKKGEYVVITVDGELYGRYSLSQSQEIDIVADGITKNLCVIKDGKADMVEADCPDKLCVHQRAVSKGGESIVCLPNRVVIAIEGGTSEIDSIAK